MISKHSSVPVLLANTDEYRTATNTKPNNNHSHESNFLFRYQVVVPTAISALTGGSETTELAPEFQPGAYDVVCGRGKGSYNRPGNKRFRAIVNQHIPQYQSSKSKLDKSMVLNTIIDRVRQQNNGNARFVKHDKKKGWFEIGVDQAREKVGHAIREAIAANKPSRVPVVTKKEVKHVFVNKQTDLLSQQQDFFTRLMLQRAANVSESAVVAL